MPSEMIDKLDRIAKRKGGINRSDLVRIIIKEYLDEH